MATFLCLALIAPAGASSAGRVIVQWAPGTPRAKRVAVRRAAGVTFESDLGNRRFQLVEVSHGQVLIPGRGRTGSGTRRGSGRTRQRQRNRGDSE